MTFLSFCFRPKELRIQVFEEKYRHEDLQEKRESTSRQGGKYLALGKHRDAHNAIESKTLQNDIVPVLVLMIGCGLRARLEEKKQIHYLLSFCIRHSYV